MDAACTSNVPMMGPVHENDTKTSVNAMKKMLSKPIELSALSFTLLVQDDGNVISNAPKNETANTTSRAKNNKLKTALVDKSFRALAPNIAVMINPNAK
jgi:hypothetical protein